MNDSTPKPYEPLGDKPKMKILTLDQLLTNWHIFKEPICEEIIENSRCREEIHSLDIDELLLMLNISCPDLWEHDKKEYKNLVISDFDFVTYTNTAVSFSIE